MPALKGCNMESVVFNKREIRKFLRNHRSIDGTSSVYVEKGDILKFYPKYLFELENRSVSYDAREVDEYSLDKLISLREKITKSSLPKGVIVVDGNVSGVLYDYFDGFKSFNDLYLEDAKLILQNLSSLVDKNNELMENGIYNTDLHHKNILYSSDRVEIIDLDGPFIKFDPYYISSVNNHLCECFLDVIRDNMLCRYSEDDVNKVIYALMDLFSSKDLNSINYGNEILKDTYELKLIR